jgi:hypothetical protein
MGRDYRDSVDHVTPVTNHNNPREGTDRGGATADDSGGTSWPRDTGVFYEVIYIMTFIFRTAESSV